MPRKRSGSGTVAERKAQPALIDPTDVAAVLNGRIGFACPTNPDWTPNTGRVAASRFLTGEIGGCAVNVTRLQDNSLVISKERLDNAGRIEQVTLGVLDESLQSDGEVGDRVYVKTGELMTRSGKTVKVDAITVSAVGDISIRRHGEIDRSKLHRSAMDFDARIQKILAGRIAQAAQADQSPKDEADGDGDNLPF